MIPLVLATMAVGLPVFCQPVGDLAGYYQPRQGDGGGGVVVIVEPWCADVESGSPEGVLLLGHELGHAFQDAYGLRFDEGQADLLAWSWWPWLRARLGGEAFVTLAGRRESP